MNYLRLYQNMSLEKLIEVLKKKLEDKFALKVVEF